MIAWDSWPRCFSSPKENDQAGVSLNTFLSLTWLSGLQRWAWVPMPYCSTLLVVAWSLAMSSQVTGLATAPLAKPTSAIPRLRLRMVLASGLAVLGSVVVLMR